MIEELIIFFYFFLAVIGSLLGVYFIGILGHGIKILYKFIRRKK